MMTRYVTNIYIYTSWLFISNQSMQTEMMVMELARPSHRSIVCVSASNPEGTHNLDNMVNQLDPNLARTTFVYTKLDRMLTDISGSTLNSYFQKNRSKNAFWVSLLGDGQKSLN